MMKMTDKDEVIKKLVGVNCPECKADIDCLNYYESGEMKYTINDEGHYEQDGDFRGDSKTTDYECPECQAVIFTDSITALNFLKGRG